MVRLLGGDSQFENLQLYILRWSAYFPNQISIKKCIRKENLYTQLLLLNSEPEYLMYQYQKSHTLLDYTLDYVDTVEKSLEKHNVIQ